LRRGARDHTPQWRALIDEEDFYALNYVAAAFRELAAERSKWSSSLGDRTLEDVLGMQDRHGVTLIDVEQRNCRLTDDALSFMTYWTAAQPLRPYLWTMCPWASTAGIYQDDAAPRYRIARQNLDVVTAVRIDNARRRIAQRALDAASRSRRLESVGLELEGAGVADVPDLVVGKSVGRVGGDFDADLMFNPVSGGEMLDDLLRQSG
jgi:hypothetical protein